METNGSVRLLGRSRRDCIIAFAVSLLHVHYGKQWGTQLPKSPLSQLPLLLPEVGRTEPLCLLAALAIPAWPGSAGDKDWGTPVFCIFLLSSVRLALGTAVIPGKAVDACRAGSQALWTASLLVSKKPIRQQRLYESDSGWTSSLSCQSSAPTLPKCISLILLIFAETCWLKCSIQHI